MVSRSKKVICLFMALLCMVSIFTDALAPKAEACATVAIAGTYAVIATAMALAGVTAATAAEQWALAQKYATQTQTDVRKQHAIEELSKVIGKTFPAPSGGGNNNEPKPGMLFSVSTNVVLLEHLSSLIDDIKDYFSADEDGQGSIEIASDNKIFSLENILFYNGFPSEFNSELDFYNHCNYNYNEFVSLVVNDETYNFGFFTYPYNQDKLCIGRNLSDNPTFIDCFCKNIGNSYQDIAFSNSIIQSSISLHWGFYSNNGNLMPIISRKYLDSNGLVCYENVVSVQGPSINIIDYDVISQTVTIDYNVHKPLNTQPLKDYLNQQTQLDEPTIQPLTIPFPYPWIIIEPDGDIVENPDIDDTPLVPINPTVPDNPEEPTESPTPTPSETPEVAPPLWPSWHDYDEWRRQLFRDIVLNPDAVISPNTTTDPDDAPTVTPDPAAPVDPDTPFKPNVDGMPDIGGTWDYVEDFLSNALIWMKLWFSGFLLLPPPIQTSLWALLVITVVLGLLKVFLQ